MTTSDFSISPTAYLNRIAQSLTGRLWWLMIAPVGLFFYGIAADYRWAIVSVMLIFIVYPMIMTIVILRYCNNPGIIRRISVNRVEICADKQVKLYTIQSDNEEGGEKITMVEQSGATGVETTARYIILYIGKGITDFMLMPRQSLSEQQIGELENLLWKK